MSRQTAMDTIEKISKKYFASEAREVWKGKNDEPPEDPPFWNIFTYKGLTREEYFDLGLALVELAGRAGLKS